jgi:hypothetical protein
MKDQTKLWQRISKAKIPESQIELISWTSISFAVKLVMGKIQHISFSCEKT